MLNGKKSNVNILFQNREVFIHGMRVSSNDKDPHNQLKTNKTHHRLGFSENYPSAVSSEQSKTCSSLSHLFQTVPKTPARIILSNTLLDRDVYYLNIIVYCISFCREVVLMYMKSIVSSFFFSYKHRRNRHVGYRQMARWIWGYLGRDVRVPLPSCAVVQIREAYPSAQYRGFREI